MKTKNFRDEYGYLFTLYKPVMFESLIISLYDEKNLFWLTIELRQDFEQMDWEKWKGSKIYAPVLSYRTVFNPYVMDFVNKVFSFLERKGFEVIRGISVSVPTPLKKKQIDMYYQNT